MFLTDPPVWQTDGQRDGQTDKTELRLLRRATAVAAVARKNRVSF